MANIALIILIILVTLAEAGVTRFERDKKEPNTKSRNAFKKMYFNEWIDIVQKERYLSISGRVKLIGRKEMLVNNYFMKLKKEELNFGFEHPDHNLAGMHFFKAKPLIEKSKVFKFIRTMPKGAVLHVHNSAAVSSDWIVKNLTRLPQLMRCVNNDSSYVLTFKKQIDGHICTDLNKERQFNKSLDELLESSINIYTPNPEDFSSINAVWKRFQNTFTTCSLLVRYLPAYRLYHTRLLEELYEDNIMYAELRMSLRGLYNSTHTLTEEQQLLELIRIVEQFKTTHPNFLGVKVIYARNRNIKPDELLDLLKSVKRIRKKFPEILIGFDLAGQEDTGESLRNLVTVLADPEVKTRYFFHAGETNWYGAHSDTNLVDSLLLNATRIGHGYALLKHPIVRQKLKEKGIAIEICPISNQVLKLVSDLRNHPASFYMAEDLPLVISNDDPSRWGARGLSYDFYYAIMSLASNAAGIETLKQLALNSIKYSVLTKKERQRAKEIFEKQWNKFIDYWYKRQNIHILTK